MTDKPVFKKRAYGVHEFARACGIGHDGIYKAIREGRLIARKFGNRTIITVEDGERFLAALPRLELPKSDGGAA